MHTSPQNEKPTDDVQSSVGQHTSGLDNTRHIPPVTSDWHRVGGGYSVFFSLSDKGLKVTWSPDIPPPRRLKRVLALGKYFIARDAFMLDISKRMNGIAVCIDL